MRLKNGKETINEFFVLIIMILLFSCGGTVSVISEDQDFLLLLEDAKIVAENAEFIEPALREIGDTMKWGIFQHAPSQVIFPEIIVGKEAFLDFSIGLFTGFMGKVRRWHTLSNIGDIPEWN